MLIKCALFTICLALAYAQTDFEIPENISLPPDLEGKIDPDQLKGLQNQTLPVIKKKCEENGGPEAYENAQKAFDEFSKCIKALVDPETLQKEIEEASPNGRVDEVFKEYCAKTPSFKECFSSVTEATRPCFSAKERDNLKTVYNVTEQLAEFVCYKEGDRIALFIAEGGRECFEEKQSELQECANRTLGADVALDPARLRADALPNIAFGEKECRQLSELQTCVVAALGACETPTTGNIVESMFKFIRKATPCSDQPEVSRKALKDSGARRAAAPALLAALLAALVARAAAPRA